MIEAAPFKTLWYLLVNTLYHIPSAGNATLFVCGVRSKLPTITSLIESPLICTDLNNPAAFNVYLLEVKSFV